MMKPVKYLTVVAAACAIAAAPARAADFYAGKQITMIAGFGVGGGYDAYARLLIRFLPKYIPGHPSIVMQNLPAAGSLVAMNTLANSAPRDGTTIGAMQNHIGVEPMLGLTGPVGNAKYDARKMNWLGSAAKEYALVIAWHTAPIKTFKDVLTHEMVVGSSGVATTDSVYARVMNALVGTKFRVIEGYKDNPSLTVAMERGEIMGRAGVFLSSVRATQGDAVKQGRLRILVQVALDKNPELPDVPLVSDFVKDPKNLSELQFALSWLPMGRPYVAPPGVPADRVKMLREAFMKAATDPELIAEGKKMHLDMSPISGEEIQALLDKLYATPRPVIEKVRSIMVAK
jgi:tripartite-type tricarboxylate transporter receptor subunit TctC